jgi:hypothetical protein
MAEQLDCSDVRKREGLAVGTAQNKLQAVARTAARKEAYEHAKQSALGLAVSYVCPDSECPLLKLTIWLGKPFDGVDPPLIVGPGPVWLWTSHCYWKARVRCTGGAIPGGQKLMKEQDLTCEEDEVAEARGLTMGTGKNKLKDACEEKAAREALANALTEIADAIDKVTCDPECPHKKLILLINGPVVSAFPPAKEGGEFNCNGQCSWSLKVTCY